jgi:transposase
VGQKQGRDQERAAKESEARLAAALAEFEKLRAQKPEVAPDKLRVSVSEPEARKMKQPDGGYVPSYNVQITTDQACGIIVGAGLSQSAGDSKQLLPALTRVKENTGKLPAQVVADGGYASGSNIKQLAEQNIDFIAPLTDQRAQLKHKGIDPAFSREAFTYDEAANHYVCPAGTKLTYQGRERRGERVRFKYRAPAAACARCVHKPQCCPKSKLGRSLNRSEYETQLLRHKTKMETVEAQAIYKQRAQTAEFPIAWLKEKIGLRRFRLRGLQKAELEILWACATHNLQQWIRLAWKPQFLKTQTQSSG